MSSVSRLAQDVLNKLNIAVLEREAPKNYRVVGEPPPFYNRLFPPSEFGPCAEPWQYSPMLEIFIADSETFFEREKEGSLSSGIWQEDGKVDGEVALIAEAMCFPDQQAIIIRLLQQDFSDRFAVLNDARHQLLQKREISKNLDHYREKSRLDGLTGLLNRGAFIEMLESAIEDSNNQFAPLSLVMLDIDDFKKFNDAFGHLAGDEVLRAVGTFLRSKCRSGDAAVRYGGEEFCVVLKGALQDDTLKAAQKICAGIRKISLPSLPPITVSVGCTVYRRGESVEQLIKRADMALYDVKYSTKNDAALR